MKINLLSLITISLMILTACGGGDSSSGAGTTAVFEDDGVYDGTQDVRFIAPDGEILDDQEFAFTMSVFENNVTITDSDFTAQAPISDGIFIASSGEFSITEDNITCDITIIYNGTIGLGSTQGTVQGNYVCSPNSGPGAGMIFNFPVDGTFDAVRGTVSSKISLINDVKPDFKTIIKAIHNRQ